MPWNAHAGTVKGPKGERGEPGSTGPRGFTGFTGPRGIRGTRWYIGTGVPNPTDTRFTGAINGDLYLDLVTGDVYTFDKGTSTTPNDPVGSDPLDPTYPGDPEPPTDPENPGDIVGPQPQPSPPPQDPTSPGDGGTTISRPHSWPWPAPENLAVTVSPGGVVTAFWTPVQTHYTEA